MFHVTIKDERSAKVLLSKDTSAPAANYYAYCVEYVIDLLNGGPKLSKVFERYGRNNPLGTIDAPKAAILEFINCLHKHPSFSPELVLNKDNINYHVFQKISALMHEVELDDTSAHIYFLNLLSQMKVPGILSISISDDFTDNERILYQYNFPNDLIPEAYFCSLSNQVMDEPCFDKRISTETRYDNQKLCRHLEETGKNPYTNNKLAQHDIAFDRSLQARINNFIKKVQLIPQYFPKTYNDIYQQRKLAITSELSSTEFEAQLLAESKANQNSPNEEVAIKALCTNAQNINPHKSYQSAIDAFKNKDFKQSIFLFQQALRIFEIKCAKDSIECFRCYSGLVSCHRDLKDYDTAIKLAEEAFYFFEGKHDLSSLVKKYEECLTIRQDKPSDIYNSAVKDYKEKHYIVSLHKLLFVIVLYRQKNDKAELATCHSTLASCYRELKNF